ncbi:MAG TPA: PrgI family protein, partial [Pseudonocardiaceae bacterium]|nr:PrgI family protein [Pseudonocardiaceae bacterium]
RIPADIDLPDRILGPFTARQLTILGVTGLILYAGLTATRAVVPWPVLLAVAAPVGLAAALLALGQRDGVPLDRLLMAAIRQRLQPRHQIPAPEGIPPAPAWLPQPTQDDAGSDRAIRPGALGLPARTVTDTGVVDLGPDGLAVIAVASTVNFALRTPAEQDGLVATFGRYLHSLTAPVQLLVRTDHLDLTGQITQLRHQAASLPHPALETAALEHADFLAHLDEQIELLRRQVILVLRESPQSPGRADGLSSPGPLAMLSTLLPRTTSRPQHGPPAGPARRAAEARLVRRLTEAIDLLAPAGIVITPLPAHQVTALLGSASNPDRLLPASPESAAADDTITTAADLPPERNDTTLGDAADHQLGDRAADDDSGWPL